MARRAFARSFDGGLYCGMTKQVAMDRPTFLLDLMRDEGVIAVEVRPHPVFKEVPAQFAINR
ncbi:hypothetical protein [Mameliella sp.]|uniref:hypothetical protein n=1 Tax=Mameliella sp. TaxID=1924940 RepID=UPI003BA88DB5